MSALEFWSGKRVLVTGNTGFKGSWLTIWLSILGAEVQGYADCVPTTPSAWDLMGLHKHVATTWGDVRDFEAVQKAVTTFDPDVLFHMAAQPFVRRSYAAPLETISTNVLGTANLLQAARDALSLRVVVNVTSDKCYENEPSRMPFNESMPMGGADPYSASKGCAELVATAFSRSFFDSPDKAAVISVRAGNVIGGGDWGEDRLVPDLIRAAQSGVATHLRSPAATRPWQHVVNPLDGYLQLAEQAWKDRAFIGGWNFGPGLDQVATVLDVATGVQDRWNTTNPLFTYTHDDAFFSDYHEAATLSIDSNKALRQLGWSPKWNLTATLDNTVAWYHEAARSTDMSDFSISQIQSYCDVASVERTA